MRRTPSGKPYPGKGQGSSDMVSICKCLQHRERKQAKKAVKLEPKGMRSGYGSHNCPYGDVAPSV